MLKSLFGFGEEKQEKFNQRVAFILSSELGIDIDIKRNPNFGGLGHIDLMSKYFYQNRTPEHCSMSLGVAYLEKLLKSASPPSLNEAKKVKANMLRIANSYTNDQLFPELKAKILELLSNYQV